MPRKIHVSLVATDALGIFRVSVKTHPTSSNKTSGYLSTIRNSASPNPAVYVAPSPNPARCEF